ncbi:hypothetical protein AAZX31_13G045200 [Glycine max]
MYLAFDSSSFVSIFFFFYLIFVSFLIFFWLVVLCTLSLFYIFFGFDFLWFLTIYAESIVVVVVHVYDSLFFFISYLICVSFLINCCCCRFTFSPYFISDMHGRPNFLLLKYMFLMSFYVPRIFFFKIYVVVVYCYG